MSYDSEEHGNQDRQRHGSPLFYRLLQEMAETHDAKSHDYATDHNPYGNYLFSGEIARMFTHSALDTGFVTRLAEKLYRLSVLEGGNKQPKNESIADTERDIATITALWMAARRDYRYKNKAQEYTANTTEPYDSNEEAVKIILEQFPKLNHFGLKGLVDFLRRALADMEAEGLAKNLKTSR